LFYCVLSGVVISRRYQLRVNFVLWTTDVIYNYILM